MLGGGHRFSNKELLVTETELAAMATPARVGHRRPKPATGINATTF
ncbi:MAG: hypothetical protein KGI02_07640 [Thaumarchaeota archaeon]|nr:hypothetical protein [Nitrososphaerota archaeon]MDE1840883.1 hypothetical protein [Nitrososphaerota archaeon]MDE1877472.1 hypothetical protein [Nitrososphaerota archaeon]